MLSLLKIKNIALIGALEVEFGPGLNLLTGETGSGKSIIVDSLGALTGERVSSDLIKDGANTAQIEGLFEVQHDPALHLIFESSGIPIENGDRLELIIRRELSTTGKNRVYINDQLVTASLLKRLAPYLVDIHGQGEQFSLFDPVSHLNLLDEFVDNEKLLEHTANAFHAFSDVKNELAALQKDEAEKLQLVDILKFQVTELERAYLKVGEEEELTDEKRRLNNVEKLSSLSSEAFALLYDNDNSASATFEKAARNIQELAEYDARFRDHAEGIENARTLIEDLSIATRDFLSSLEFSPERLEEIESRLDGISRLTRKYGGSVEAAIEHLEQSKRRLTNIETSELREKELTREVNAKRADYLNVAQKLSGTRAKAAKQFSKEVEKNLQPLALEKARFEVRVDAPAEPGDHEFGISGVDRVEFYFSANVGESPKPLIKVASGGEASRLMLILKTTAKTTASKTAVFDEIDAGIGGRVSESVGAKLNELAKTQQVLCVTHQAQVASQADRHFLVEKEFRSGKTIVSIRELNANERVEEIARMLAGETITDAARENARAMLAAAGIGYEKAQKAQK
ncbi:MAG TPA: DNA repair protein RecN [Pyrinomonadaceae bacterium]|nr:DNA repair protein RecN [Pyrinomonadaceae bacterium]